MKELIEQYIIVYSIIGFGLFGMLVKFVTSLIYKKLIRESDKMGSSNHPLLKLIRMKFETCYQLRIGVHNVSSFSEKYIYKYRVMGMLLSTWEGLGTQILLICMCLGTTGLFGAVFYGMDKEIVLSIFFTSIIVCMILIIYDSIVNISSMQKRLQVNIVDYLDNYLKIRLESQYMTEKDATKEQVKENALLSYERDEGMEELIQSLMENSEQSSAISAEQESGIIEEVLREYFI